MLKKMGFILSCFILLPHVVHGFDCNKPDFGAHLEDLNKDGYFVKYMEKEGISYYNYTGPCRMDRHNYANLLISYAFIENRLYARIIRVGGSDEYFQDVKSRMEKIVTKEIGVPIYEMKPDGDWLIYQWTNKQDKIRFKVKINSKTNERKSAFYYEPLRAKLPNLNEAEDPVSFGD